MKTLSQHKKALRKAQTHTDDVAMMFVDNPVKANRIWKRTQKAHTAYIKAKERHLAQSTFRTFTAAKTAVLKYRQAKKKVSTFIEENGGIGTPEKMNKFMADIGNRRQYQLLTVEISKKQRMAQLAIIAFPKLKL